MTDWILFDDDEPLAVFRNKAEAESQLESMREWDDDDDTSQHRYEIAPVMRLDYAGDPIHVRVMTAGAATAYEELWWPWNIIGILADRVIAGEVVEWAPGVWRGTDRGAVETAAYRAREAR